VSARYVFLPWVREGASTGYPVQDPLTPVLAPSPGRSLQDLPVRLSVNEQTPVDVALRLYGPGDVTGLDPRVVIRVYPPHRTADLEPNLLAFVEFDPPHFPWLFTPAAAGRNGRLRPWLVLVVVRAESAMLRAGDQGSLPVLVTSAEELPDLIESWVWAHAQAVQPDPAQPVAEILAKQPQGNLSRLVGPRRLEPDTRYLACVVPAFEAGRKSGLGLPVNDADERRLAPAWDGSQPQVTLPVYYSWTFGTGSGGDFESLARRLTGRPIPDHVGRRRLLVGDQPYGVPELGERTFEGPLLAFGGTSGPPVEPAFAEALRGVLNLNSTASRPVVTPPVYGSWQAAAAVVPDEGEPPRWLREANLDPALRAAAGLGARVVREQQEQLVAAAWDQLADGPVVTRLAHRLDLSIAVLGSVLRRHVATMQTGRLVQLLGPAQTRLRAPAGTLHARLVSEGLPASFSSAPFRRVQRPAGTLARRRSPAPISPQRVATRVATAVPPAGPPPGTIGLVREAHLRARMGFTGATPATEPAATPAAEAAVAGPAAAADPAFGRYRAAIADVQAYFGRFADQPASRPRPRFEFTAAVKASLVASLDPQAAVTRRFAALVSLPTGSTGLPLAANLSEVGTAAIASVLVQPSFARPMYEALQDLAPDLLLPGVEAIEADTVTLLDSNGRFIEAFLLGLNHELAAELLWREFPADLRHTYFRTFWDPRGTVGQPGQLPPIHTWQPSAALGDSFAAGAQGLVLLIRGELLQRYPDALIYAVRARTPSALGTEELMPQFRGRIEPDITFLGFDLTEDAARGDAAQPGWFFVIQEQPTGPRFGLDEVRVTDLSTWNDLAWSDTRTEPGAALRLADLTVPATRQPPGDVWGFNGAHMASILRQRTVRLAFHARRLLPTPALGVDR
jgi:hypothetical protein